MTRYGGWSTLDEPRAAWPLLDGGFDWIAVDEQHGSAQAPTRDAILAAASARGIPAYVRVAANLPHLIGHALDSGARGVIVPLVESAGEAAAAVGSTLYPPLGRRSWGPRRGAVYGTSMTDVSAANAAAECHVMVESPTALAALPAMLDIAGLTGVFVGTHDLSLEMGTTVDELLESPEVLVAIVDTCERAHVVAGAFAGTPTRAARLAELGFTMVAVASDTAFVASGIRSAMAELR